ncbi:MAG TPA: YihY/virulence factor BrkB family protein [Terriglobales bacterium]|nr:YihY/virulence factor BrkB family protein [Terriglobales bacterium]
MANSLWTTGGLSLWQLTGNVARAIRDDDLLGRASGLAFNYLLAFFPFLLFLLVLFGLFASRSSQLEARFLFYFAHVLPPSAFQLLKQVAGELSYDPSASKLTFSIAIALLFASGGLSSTISALNEISRVPDSRSWLRIRAAALGLTIVLTIFLLFSLSTVLAGARLMDWLGAMLNLQATSVFLSKTIQWPLAMLFLTVSFSLIYYFGRDVKSRRWHWISPGSLVGVLLWLVASVGFRFYLRYFDTYNLTYGSLGAVMILLTWMYVSGFAFLVGREIDAEIELATSIPPSSNG